MALAMPAIVPVIVALLLLTITIAVIIQSDVAIILAINPSAGTSVIIADAIDRILRLLLANPIRS